MDLLDLMAKLSLNTDEYDKGLKNAESGMETSGSAITAKAVALGNLAADAIKTGATAVIDFAKSSIQAGSDFDSAMSQVAATMGTTTDKVKDLREYAKEMGATTAFSATQAADGINILAMAGLTSNDIMKKGASGASALETTLNLAAAGGMSMADAAAYAMGAVKGFGDEASNASYYADLMAKGATLAMTDVQQLGEAMGGISATASTYGQSADSVTVSLLRLAEANVTGSNASTALAAAMKDIYTPSDEGAKVLKQLGVAAYEDGKALDFNDVVNSLTASLSKMTDEQKNSYLQTIFGIQGLRAYNQMAAVSADTQQKFWDGLGEAAGSAADQAQTQLDNLEGDTTMFQSALEGVQITISEKLNPAMRAFTQLGGAALQGFNDGFASGGLSSAIEGMIKGFVQALPKAISSVTEFAGKMISAFGSAISALAPKMMESAHEIVANLASGLASNLPTLLSQALPMIVSFTGSLRENIGQIVDMGLELITGLVQGIANSLPVLIENVPQIIINICGIINDNMPKILETGINLIVILGKGIIQAVPALIANFPKIMEAIIAVVKAINWINLGKTIITGITNGVKALASHPVQNIKSIISKIKSAFSDIDWGEIGKNVIRGIANGIKAAAGIIADAAVNAAKDAFEAAKGFLGIHSPSTLMRDKIGRFMALGMAEGISDYSGAAVESMRDASRAVSDAATLSMSSDFTGSGTDTRAAAYAPVTINVYGAEGQSVTDLAEKISDIINANIYRQKAVFA